MQKFFSIHLLLIFYPILLFSQKGFNIDTLIYQKNGEPYRLIPNWVVGKSDTFNLSKIDIIIKNGDTIADKRFFSRIIHRVESVNDTAIFQTAKIGKEIYQQQVFDKDLIPKNPRIKDFFEVIYQTNRNGANIKVINCSELQKHLIPDLLESIDSMEQKNSKDVYHIRSYPDKMKECKAVQSFLTNDLEMFHQLFNQLVPIQETVKYEIKLTDKSDKKNTMSMYLQVRLATKENGNKVFELSEDLSKDETIFNKIVKQLTNVFIKGDNNEANDSEDIDDDNTTSIEFDKFNYPVKIVKRYLSTEKNKKETSINLYEYKIESIRQ